MLFKNLKVEPVNDIKEAGKMKNEKKSDLIELYQMIKKYHIPFDMARSLIKGDKRASVELPCSADISLIVDYSITLKSMISLGNYFIVDNKITKENFPLPKIKGKVKMSAKIIDSYKHFSFYNFIIETYRMGYRPAGLFELLALRINHPQLIIQMLKNKEGKHVYTGPHIFAYDYCIANNGYAYFPTMQANYCGSEASFYRDEKKIVTDLELDPLEPLELPWQTAYAQSSNSEDYHYLIIKR